MNNIKAYPEDIPCLFNHDDKESYYILVNEIDIGKSLSSHQELENNREVLKKNFLDRYDGMLYGLKDNPYYWTNYIDRMAYLVKHVDNKLLLDLDFSKVITRFANPIVYVDTLFAVFMPEVLSKANFNDYLNCFYELINFNINFEKGKIDCGNYRINNIFNYLHDISQEYSYDYLEGELSYLPFIICYLYANNIDDLSIIREYLANRDYYKDKLILNNVYLIHPKYGTYNYKNASNIFNNFDSFFNKEKRLIK